MSQSSPAPSPGIHGLAALFGRVVFTALFRALTYPIRTNRAPAFRTDVLFAVLRKALHHITIPQSRYLNQSTSERYLSFCKKQSVDPKTLIVKRKDGKGTTTAHWIGSPDAEAVVLYLHGGGYTQPATEGYYHYFTRLVKDLNASGKSKSVSVLLLAYTLAPEAIFPTQLQQAATFLDYLLNETGRSPGNIFITGDSAGGGLSITLLSHLLHPHPDVPRIELSAPLAGILVYSPWVSFSTDHDSFIRNAQLDMIPPIMLRRWAAMYLGKSDPSDPELAPKSIAGDSYSEVASNPPSWWSGLHNVVANVFIWAGTNEVLVDSVRELAHDLRDGWGEGGGSAEHVTYFEAPLEAHIQPIMDVMSSGGIKSDSQEAIEAWYRVRLND